MNGYPSRIPTTGTQTTNPNHSLKHRDPVFFRNVACRGKTFHKYDIGSSLEIIPVMTEWPECPNRWPSIFFFGASIPEEVIAEKTSNSWVVC